MKIWATVAEFNPFHNGHGYLINDVRHNCDGIVAVMSGNFVQRGSAAVYDKFSRANAAVKGGVDLVIELPVIYALSSAEDFALGAVKLLNSSNSIHTLFFGSESGDIAHLVKASLISLNETDDIKAKIKKNLSSGMSYPKALSDAYASFAIDISALASPNNILGIEYIKAMAKTNSQIQPYTVKRIGASHDSSHTSGHIASASHIRSLVENGENAEQYMPRFPYPAPVSDNDFSHILLYALKSAAIENFLALPHCSPQLASRFISASSQSNIADVISAVKSKNFTESRIRRIMWNLALKNTLSSKTDPSYIRVLAQNKKGAEIISYMKNRSSIPVVQKGAELKNDPIFIVESRATDIYNIVRDIPSGDDFRYSPIPII